MDHVFLKIIPIFAHVTRHRGKNNVSVIDEALLQFQGIPGPQYGVAIVNAYYFYAHVTPRRTPPKILFNRVGNNL